MINVDQSSFAQQTHDMSDLQSPHHKKRRLTNADNRPALGASVASDDGVRDSLSQLNQTSPGVLATQPPLSQPTDLDSSGLAVDQQTLSQNPFSPNFAFSPWPPSFMNSPVESRQMLAPNVSYSQQYQPQPQQQPGGQLEGTFTYHSVGAQDQNTPGGISNNGSLPSESDKDPFLTLLEQLAENENGQGGGPSDLDFFLRGQA